MRGDLEFLLLRHGIGRRVRERIVRLNPEARAGFILKGWHPAASAKRVYARHGNISKGAFIRAIGRAAWEVIPNSAKIKDGRRQYVSQVFMEDCMWKIWTGECCPMQRPIYPTRRYSNDPRCPVEYAAA